MPPEIVNSWVLSEPPSASSWYLLALRRLKESLVMNRNGRTDLYSVLPFLYGFDLFAKTNDRFQH